MSYASTLCDQGPGKPQIDLLAPDAAKINIECLMTSISRANRFGGSGNGTVDTLSHSFCVARIAAELAKDRGYTDIRSVERTFRLGLLHDAHEALTGDITTPMANAIGRDVINKIKADLDLAIFAAAQLPPRAAWQIECVKLADEISLIHEAMHLGLIYQPSDWGFGHIQVNQRHFINLQRQLAIPRTTQVFVALEALDPMPWDWEEVNQHTGDRWA